MSKAFYRKYRSKKLSEVVGQKHITTVLEKALNQGKIAHAYLFTGPRGVGKTSIARILAHEINNLPYNEEENHPDIIEIDAASNNGVEDIRELRDRIQIAPFSAKYRIYIIDEVHMLSKAAFNALLKTLEEPPEHAIFILATTDAHKLPATIISRTQRFVFRFISKEDVVSHLRFISDSEKIKISDEALEIIAERGGGSFRDSISLLDQISSLNNKDEISAKVLEDILGLAPKAQIQNLINAYENQNAENILKTVTEIRNSGVDLKAFASQLTEYVRNSLGEKPYLSKLLIPLIKAEKSDFIELELLSILINETFTPIQPKNSIPAINTPPIKTPQIDKPVIMPAKPAKVSTTTPEAKKEVEELKKEPKQEAVENPKDTNEETQIATNETVQSGDLKEFNWHGLINAIDENDKGLQTILKQSGHTFNGDILKIYTGTAFKKKQLDKAKSQASIGKALKEIGAGNWLIETYGTAKPADDPVAAKVQEIMGGEEVSLNE